MLIETLIAGLLAPVTMLTQSADVVSILLGRDSGWAAQQRDDGSLPLGAVVRLYWRHTLFGLLFGVAAYLVSPFLAAWMLPVVLGLALAVPLAVLTARRDLGLLLRRLGLLAIPEEAAPPTALHRAGVLLRELRGVSVEAEATTRLARDPALLEAHRRMLPPPRRPREGPPDATLLVGLARAAEAESLEDALAGLTRAEKAAVLGDAGGLDRLVLLARRDGKAPRTA